MSTWALVYVCLAASYPNLLYVTSFLQCVCCHLVRTALIIFGAPPRSADRRQKFVDAWSAMDELLSAACKSQWRSFPQRPGTFYLLVLFFVASFLPTRPAAAVATPNTINLLVLHLYLCVTVLAASCGQGWGSFCVQDACLAAATDARLEKEVRIRFNILVRFGGTASQSVVRRFFRFGSREGNPITGKSFATRFVSVCLSFL